MRRRSLVRTCSPPSPPPSSSHPPPPLEEEKSSKQIERKSQFDTNEVTRSEHVKVDYEGTATNDAGRWHRGHSLSYLQIKAEHVVKISCEITAADQQWGNTGLSYIHLQVHDNDSIPEECIKATDLIANLNYNYQLYTKEYDCDSVIVKALKENPSAVLHLVLESAPYPGWCCQATSGKIIVECALAWEFERLIWLGLYHQECQYPICSDDVMRHILSFLDGRRSV